MPKLLLSCGSAFTHLRSCNVAVCFIYRPFTCACMPVRLHTIHTGVSPTSLALRTGQSCPLRRWDSSSGGSRQLPAAVHQWIQKGGATEQGHAPSQHVVCWPCTCVTLCVDQPQMPHIMLPSATYLLLFCYDFLSSGVACCCC
jgi:hypothetical protein